MEIKLYIGNLAYATSEEELKTLFANAGTVTAVDLIKDRDTGRSKGFAFIKMSKQEEAEKAISLYNGYSLGGRELRVSIARPREDNRGGFSGPRRDGAGPRREGSGRGGYGGDRGRNQRGGGGGRDRNDRGGSQR